MAFKSMRNSRRISQEPPIAQPSDFMLPRQDLLDPFALGSCTPCVDICQIESLVLVRVELPGVDASDVDLSFQAGSLQIQGIKREPPQSRKLLCYYCLERRYGRFSRSISIDWIVNPRQARARMDHGILQIEFPKLKDRRGDGVKIKIKGK